MKIIRQGNKELADNKRKRTLTFQCNDCYCIWTADNTEYNCADQYNMMYYYMPCPCCGHITYTDFEKGKL